MISSQYEVNKKKSLKNQEFLVMIFYSETLCSKLDVYHIF